MKGAIVTGATGFIGGAVARELLAHGYTVYGVIRPGREGALPPGCVPVVCDLAEAGRLVDLIPAGTAQIFFHFAWGGVVGPTRSDERLQLSNVQLTVDSVRAAKKLGCTRFVCPGSIAERDVVASLYSERGRPNARWLYGSAKTTARAMGLNAALDAGISAVWGTAANTYGPGDRRPNIVPASIQKILRGETPEFTAGTQIYDFLYIDDAAKALRLIGEKGKPFRDYVIGSGHARPLREFLLEMQAAIAPHMEFKFGAIPFGDQGAPLSCYDSSATEADTGFRAEVPFAEGCRRTMEWLQSRERRL